MSIAYNDLVGDICGYLQIRTTDIDKFEVGISLNRAQDHLLNVLKPRYLVNAVRTWKGNLLDGEPAYQWPINFIRFLKMWIDYENSITHTNIGREARLVGDTELLNTSNIDLLPSKEHPVVSMGMEGGFEIRPIPDADVNEAWRLRYVAKLPKIASDQPCLLRDNLRNLLTFYATSLSAGVENYSPEISQTFLGFYKEELEFLQPKSLPTKEEQ